MWSLVPVDPGGGVSYYILPDQEYVVGRKNCAILLQNDQSISRAHAVLSVSSPTSSQSIPSSSLILKDNSKYGTFLNDERLPSDSPRSLQPGDRITFGVFNSKFRVERTSFVVCSSCLENRPKATLSKSIQKLGGRIVNSWTEDCTHLIMPYIKVTIKTICALISCCPIVKPEYFTAFFNAVEHKENPPSIERFYPPLGEPCLKSEDIDFQAKPQRRTLFQGMTFLFLSEKQYKRLHLPVTLGGGKATLIEEGDINTSLLESEGTCVISVEVTNSQIVLSSSASVWIDSLTQILKSKGLRLIAESEIGYAVIYSSTETYCNPCCQIDSEFSVAQKTIPGASLSQSIAIDETIMPSTSVNVTTYVPDTEVLQIHTRMETSDIREVEETPLKDNSVASLLHNGLDKNNSHSCSTSGAAPPLFTSHSMSRNMNLSDHTAHSKSCSTELTGSSLPSCSKKIIAQSNSLEQDIKSIGKKRNREENDSDNKPIAKHIRSEDNKEKSLPCVSSQNRDCELIILEYHSLSKDCPEIPLTKKSCADRSEASCASFATSQIKGNDEKGNEKQLLNKRKEVKRLFVDTEMEDLEEIMSDAMEPHDERITPISKKMRTESGKAVLIKQETLDPLDLGNAPVQPLTDHSTQTLRSYTENDTKILMCPERDIEAHPAASISIQTPTNSAEIDKNIHFLKKDSGTSSQVHIKNEDSEEVLRNLLLTEFKSLVVRPKQSPACSATSRQAHIRNFKKFKKIPFPGSVGLPNIIGGSDLVAHHTRKSSELEEWLRQEAEEQSQYAREESLADDLFRYNPRVAKRR
ncbi:nibrin isoform X2 [Polypterus senegalus]|uniref:nibrin isoform X2 n=1 Tax=Polypterus senegalus TaxID=55291 RepID=UPI001964202B|nr:nibrin isoform X2 [Polypterus senegalus]